jgi:hypothetical protein
MPAQVERQRSGILFQARNLRLPHPAVQRVTMDEEQRLPLPLVIICQANIMKLDLHKPILDPNHLARRPGRRLPVGKPVLLFSNFPYTCLALRSAIKK